MASNAEIKKEIRNVINKLEKKGKKEYTVGDVRRKVTSHFGIDTSERKRFIADEATVYYREFHGIDDEQTDGGVDGQTGDGEGKEEQQGEEKEEKNELLLEDEPKGLGGLDEMYELSTKLKQFSGRMRMTHSQVQACLLDYVRENNLLQEDKTAVVCDVALENLLGVKKLSIYRMQRLVTKHMWKKDPQPGESEQGKMLEVEVGGLKRGQKRRGAGDNEVEQDGTSKRHKSGT